VRAADGLLNCARLRANPLRDGDAKPPVLRIDIDRKIAGLPATRTYGLRDRHPCFLKAIDTFRQTRWRSFEEHS
jgi:hypothetical protein